MSDLTPDGAPESGRCEGVSVAVARGNLLLDGLSDADVTLLISEAHDVPLGLGTVLYEPGRSVRRSTSR